MSIAPKLKQHLEDTLKDKIVQISSVGGGCSYPAYILTGQERQYFLKTNDNDVDVFAKESHGLEALSKSGISTPKVLGFSQKYLLLEYLEPAQPNEQFWIDLATMLAKAHNHKNEGYGFVENNYIGRSQQINMVSQAKISWPEFFWKYRIKIQLEWIEDKHGFGLPIAVHGALEQTILEKLSRHSTFPAPLHGDLWAGNVYCGKNQSPYLLDPAYYFGDREADLAMTELFGGFPEIFYITYQKEFPLQPGYNNRKVIYNLYHLLNHFLIFGSSYVNSVENSINQILR